MIKFFDYLFLNLYQFVFFLRRDELYAKHGAVLYMGAIISLGLIAIINSFVFAVYDHFIKWSLPQIMGIFIIGVVFPVIRYFFFANLSEIKQSYNALSRINRNVLRIMYYVLIVAILYGAFVLKWIYG